MISLSHRFLSIHIPKVAGMSVTTALEEAVYGPAWRFVRKAANRVGRDLNWRVQWPMALVNVHPPHLSCAAWKRKLSPKVFDGMFKFAFVRNPWDWQVSLYHYISQDPGHPKHDVVRGLGSFEQYIEWRVTKLLVLQRSFLVDGQGNNLVDFVGRFERIAQDFEHVCEVLKMPGVRLPHINASRHRDFRTYYNDRTRALVEKHFQPDIAAFGYSFDSDACADATKAA